MRCLDIDVGECLEPQLVEWSLLCGVEPIVDTSEVWGHAEAQSELSQCVTVQGRLKENSDFWLNELEPSSFVADIVTKGYSLPFIMLPGSKHQTNHNSALANASFVESAIRELVSARCVVESNICPVVCSPLSVVVNPSGKQRLVLDLRYVNQFLPNRKFKYEGLELVPSLFSRGDFFTTFDLKSGYHHVDMHEDYWPYLGFSWGDACSKRWFMFRVLPFGLSTACYVFTKLLRPLVKRWRSKGYRCIVYIDDGICASESREVCVAQTDMIVKDLSLAGFILNSAKSRLEPQQSGSWLGFVLDLREGKYFVPEKKISRLCNCIDSAFPSSHIRARVLASIVGQIISMSLAIGPVARLRTRILYDLLNSRRSWSDMLRMSDAARQEMQFWKFSIEFLNGCPIWFSPGATRIVFSDASASGYGGCHEVEIGPDIAHGQWSQYETTLSSTWRELKAVALVLSSFIPKLAGHRVKWFTDNQNVVRIVEAGSRKQHLHCIALQIFETCFRNCIRLDMEWIPRTLNEKADYISRVQDFDDWRVDPQLFATIDSLWGPHSVDVFAHVDNTQLPRFYSRFWCPGAIAVDAFTVNWAGEVNWWVPPVHLVGRVLRHAQHCSAMGSLLVPAWKSASFWPLLCPDGQYLAPFVHQWMFIPFDSSIILPGKSGNSIGSAMTPDSIIMCLWLDFAAPPREHNFGFCTWDFSGVCSFCS